ncbi:MULTISPECIES: DUF3302 domain-containing protein [Bradyrhizobium]|uniref:DUF3302 domain-containing protein n=1 Tax=Bradyrhizobium TaxID=374 RepID=UPI0004B395DC|nr:MULTISPECIES: DUF3302 domain-containing protein [Bradyrhizobium]MCP1971766.1 hypothetical protein [Bradyrhizobium elkanii]MCS3451980.1 hypothetical protein [Bradyrhizobium elkanii]MCS3518915.1 hypothetical protein [Bradyrhizobium elkanii]MCS3565921.1 hypothetical protein [Bradyrhizobium elkanii]MCS4075473.1 hypothetical protein [Bradyrhizobium elkanii]
MDSSFGALDAFAFVVFAVLIFVGVMIVVNLGKLPGQLTHKWNHPQAGDINAMSWIGIATGGLLWPVAFIWAFTTPFGVKSAKSDLQPHGVERDAGDGVTSGEGPQVRNGHGSYWHLRIGGPNRCEGRQTRKLLEAVADGERLNFNDELRGHSKLALFFDVRGLGYEI